MRDLKPHPHDLLALFPIVVSSAMFATRGVTLLHAQDESCNVVEVAVAVHVAVQYSRHTEPILVFGRRCQRQHERIGIGQGEHTISV